MSGKDGVRLVDIWQLSHLHNIPWSAHSHDPRHTASPYHRVVALVCPGRSTLPGTGCLLDVAVAGEGYYRLEKIGYAIFFPPVILGISPQLDSFWAKETRSLSTSTQHAECKTDSDLRTLEVIRTGLKELKIPVKKVYMTHLHLIGTSALSRSPGWAGLWYNSDGPSIHMCKATYKALYI